jgi:cytoskeletal protein CcmA (bactofilin family)
MNVEKYNGLLNDVEIDGSLIFHGSLSFDGRLRNGEIVGENLVIGPRAVIQGNIQATSLVLHGTVTGDVTVAERCDIRSTGNLTGNLVASRLAMEDGATLMGGVTIKRDAAQSVKPKPESPKGK